MHGKDNLKGGFDYTNVIFHQTFQRLFSLSYPILLLSISQVNSTDKLQCFQPLQLTPLPAASRPSTSLLTLPLRREPESPQPMTEADFFARQARLQAEARMALAQAKEMAHMQMEVERQRQKKSPITEMVRSSLEKVFYFKPEM